MEIKLFCRRKLDAMALFSSDRMLNGIRCYGVMRVNSKSLRVIEDVVWGDQKVIPVKPLTKNIEFLMWNMLVATSWFGVVLLLLQLDQSLKLRVLWTGSCTRASCRIICSLLLKRKASDGYCRKTMTPEILQDSVRIRLKRILS